MQYQGFVDIIEYVTAAKRVEVKSVCNGFVAINRGNGVAYVNGFRLLPALVVGGSGESYNMGGNLGECYTRPDIEVNFDPQSQPEVQISQKVYGEIVNKL
jgi:hypothetical protein